MMDQFALILDSGRKLDDLDGSELQAVYLATHFHPRVAGRWLFPDRPTGYTLTASQVGNYCMNRSMHVQDNPELEQIYRPIAERIYDRLPAYAQALIR